MAKVKKELTAQQKELINLSDLDLLPKVQKAFENLGHETLLDIEGENEPAVRLAGKHVGDAAIKHTNGVLAPFGMRLLKKATKEQIKALRGGRKK